MLVGHQGVIGALSSQLPPVSIITGPPSVGKRLIAAHAAMSNNVSRIDFTEINKLTVDEASRVKSFMAVQPMGKIRFALIDIDLASSPAINDLLKALEEPPSYARFSLISSKRVPSTLLTRGHKYTVGLLNSDDLLSILLAKNIPRQDALNLSKLGRVDLALSAYADISAKSTAISVVQSVEANDYELFMQAFKGVDDRAASMILALLEESASQRWKIFNPSYLGAFANKKVSMAVLSSWSNVASARPQLAIRVALESVMRG